MHNWFTLLYTWNQHNIVNQLYFNKKSVLNNKNYSLKKLENTKITWSFTSWLHFSRGIKKTILRFPSCVIYNTITFSY